MTDIQPDRIRPHFETRLARDDTDLRAAQRLRYEVFVEELGARQRRSLLRLRECLDQ